MSRLVGADAGAAESARTGRRPRSPCESLDERWKETHAYRLGRDLIDSDPSEQALSEGEGLFLIAVWLLSRDAGGRQRGAGTHPVTEEPDTAVDGDDVAAANEVDVMDDIIRIDEGE